MVVLNAVITLIPIHFNTTQSIGTKCVVRSNKIYGSMLLLNMESQKTYNIFLIIRVQIMKNVIQTLPIII